MLTSLLYRPVKGSNTMKDDELLFLCHGEIVFAKFFMAIKHYNLQEEEAGMLEDFEEAACLQRYLLLQKPGLCALVSATPCFYVLCDMLYIVCSCSATAFQFNWH